MDVEYLEGIVVGKKTICITKEIRTNNNIKQTIWEK
jgi:hypothetical protein